MRPDRQSDPGNAEQEPERGILRLEGCTPTPLASYLKALGVLRLVAEQRDASARGWWKNDVFHLESVLDREELEGFFLEEYEPTPVIGPWGARSGFYPGNSEASARDALETILDSGEERLGPFRNIILRMREVLVELGVVEKSDARKEVLLAACRSLLPDDVLPWLDACYVLVDEDARYPPLLGTGGNEGSGSYSSGFSQTVVECILDRSHDASLAGTLYGLPVASGLTGQTPGHFDPGKSGGVNSSTGFDAHTGMGAWAYLLAIEGSLCFSSAVTRRHDSGGPGAAAFPFMTNTSGAGSGAIAIADEDAHRGEIWCPLWHRPARYSEVESVFREGRTTLRDSSGRSRIPRDGLGFARAAASLGVDRGIAEFERYGFLKRHGRNVVAVPLGRRPVSANASVALLEDLDVGGWLSRFRRLGRDKFAPARLTQVVRQLESAIFDLTGGAGTSQHVQRCLVVLGDCQQYLSSSPGAREKSGVPIPALSEEWVVTADDGSPEYAIAVGLAGLHGIERDASEKSWRSRILTMAEYMAPVDDGRRRRWSETDSNRVVWARGALDRNLARVMSRRLLDQSEMNLAEVPLHGDAHLPVELVAEWLTRPDWDRRIAELLSGIALAGRTTQRAIPPRSSGFSPPAAYALLKPFFVPDTELDAAMPAARRRSEPVRLPAPSELVRLLTANDHARAFSWARTHLRGRGLVAPDTSPTPPAGRGTRLLAALMVPVRRKDLASILTRFFDPNPTADLDAGDPVSITLTTED